MKKVEAEKEAEKEAAVKKVEAEKEAALKRVQK